MDEIDGVPLKPLIQGLRSALHAKYGKELPPCEDAFGCMLVQSLQTLQKSSASARKATEESLRSFLLNAFAGLPQNGDLRIHALAYSTVEHYLQGAQGRERALLALMSNLLRCGAKAHLGFKTTPFNVKTVNCVWYLVGELLAQDADETFNHVIMLPLSVLSRLCDAVDVDINRHFKSADDAIHKLTSFATDTCRAVKLIVREMCDDLAKRQTDSPAAVFDADVLDAILNSSPVLDAADSFVASANTVDTADADGADAVTPAPAPANAAQDAGGVHNSDKSGANKRKRLHSDLDELAKLEYEEENGKWRPVTLYRFRASAKRPRCAVVHFGQNEYEGLDGDYTAELDATSGHWVVRDGDGDVVSTRPRPVTSHDTLNMEKPSPLLDEAPPQTQKKRTAVLVSL